MIFSIIPLLLMCFFHMSFSFPLHRFTDSFRQLVGTRGGFEATMDTLQPLDYLLGVHAFNKTTYSLGVAAAASIKLNMMNDSLSDFELNHLTASALGVVGVFHSSNVNG